MPISRFDQVGPGAGLDIVGGSQDRSGIDPSVNVRSDPTIYHHAEASPLPEPLPLPPAPSEAELRERLRAALDVHAAADAALLSATAAHARAEQHRQHCTTALASYSTLDDEAAEFTADSLRGGQQRPLPDDLIRRLGEQARAQLDAQAAERALAVLAAELEAARVAAENVARATRAAEAAVLAITATQLAYGHLRLLAEASAIVEALHGFDKTTASSGAMSPPQVALVLRAHGADGFSRPSDTSQWRKAAEALRADPLHAAISIDVRPATERHVVAAAMRQPGPRVAMVVRARKIAEPEVAAEPPEAA